MALLIRLGPDGTSAGFPEDRLISTPVFSGAQIGTTDSGAETQMIEAHKPETFTLVTGRVLLCCQIATVVRHNPAVQVISDAVYPASPSFA